MVDPTVIEIARRWRSLHDAWSPPPKPLPPADLMDAAAAWQRRRQRAQYNRNEAARAEAEAAERTRAPSTPSRLPPGSADAVTPSGSGGPRRLNKRVSTASYHIRERTKQAISDPNGGGATLDELDLGNGDAADEEGDHAPNGGGGARWGIVRRNQMLNAAAEAFAEPDAEGEEEEAGDASLSSLPSSSTGDASPSHLDHPVSPRSPAGARRVRCTGRNVLLKYKDGVGLEPQKGEAASLLPGFGRKKKSVGGRIDMRTNVQVIELVQ